MWDCMATAIIKAIHVHISCSPIRVHCGNTPLFQRYVTSCTDHTYDTPLCRRTDEKTKSNFQVFHNGLRQVSRQCRHREVPITMVSVPSHVYSLVIPCVNCYTCPYDNSWLKKFLHSACRGFFLTPAWLLPPLKLKLVRCGVCVCL